MTDIVRQSSIVVESKGDRLVVDSRLVAEQLGIEHRAFVQTIKKYESRIEQDFGVVTFEMLKPLEGSQGGRPEKFAWLSEDQCLFLMTLSRNTGKVVECKANLVRAFSEARKTQTALPKPQPVEYVLPKRDIVDYIEAANKLQSLDNGILKHLLRDALVDQVSLEQNLKYLPVAEKPKQYTTVKVRAKSLGYSDYQIGDGSGLGKFVKSCVEPAFQELIGRYPTYHYEINSSLDQAITRYFS